MYISSRFDTAYHEPFPHVLYLGGLNASEFSYEFYIILRYIHNVPFDVDRQDTSS